MAAPRASAVVTWGVGPVGLGLIESGIVDWRACFLIVLVSGGKGVAGGRGGPA